MKNKIFFFISFFLVITLVGCKSSADTSTMQIQNTKETSFLTYTNTEYGVSIQYPHDWSQEESDTLIAVFTSPKTSNSDAIQENMNLVMNDISNQGVTLDSYTEIALEQLHQGVNDITIISSEKTTLAKNPAYRVVYTTGNFEILQVWTIQEDISYIWTFASEKNAYARYSQTIDFMLDSFTIKSIKQTTAATITDTISNTPKEETKTESSKKEFKDEKTLFAGSYRIFSERIFYDIGGAGSTVTPTSRTLDLNADGLWTYGESQGTWKVSEITKEDWKRWGTEAYGPTRKITLDHWNKKTSDGPIEETNERIDFLWIIYHGEPPLVQNAGTIWMKFGHT